jgi:hypothetical protein
MLTWPPPISQPVHLIALVFPTVYHKCISYFLPHKQITPKLNSIKQTEIHSSHIFWGSYELSKESWKSVDFFQVTFCSKEGILEPSAGQFWLKTCQKVESSHQLGYCHTKACLGRRICSWVHACGCWRKASVSPIGYSWHSIWLSLKWVSWEEEVSKKKAVVSFVSFQKWHIVTPAILYSIGHTHQPWNNVEGDCPGGMDPEGPSRRLLYSREISSG